MANNTSREYEQLRKRNRRRLIGTIILVFIVFIILWKAFSQKAPQQADGEGIIIDRSGTEAIPYDTNRPPLDVMEASDVSGAIIDLDLEDVDILATGTSVSDASSPVATTTPPATTPPVATTPPQTLPSKPVEKPVAATPPKKPDTTGDKKPAKTDDKPKDKNKKPVVIDKKPAKTDTKKPVNQNNDKKPGPQAILDGALTKPNNSSSTSSSSTGSYVIQVAALSSEKQAADLKNRLNGMGINANISTANTSKGQINRVRVGPFTNRAEAEKTLNRLQSSNLDGIIVSQ